MRQAGLAAVLLLALVSLTAGCSSHNSGQIEGTKWTSLPTTIDRNDFAEGTFKLEFSANGSLVVRDGDKMHEGTYSLAEGDSVVFSFTDKVRGLLKHPETIKIEGDRLTATDPDGTVIIYKKVP